MAQILTKKRLTESEIDNLVVEQLAGTVFNVCKEFDFIDIQIALSKKDIEICAADIQYSIKRLNKLSNWTIKTSNPSVGASESASDEADYKHKIRVCFDIELVRNQKADRDSGIPGGQNHAI